MTVQSEAVLDASSLKAILDKLPQPGSLRHDPFLQSWVVQMYLSTYPAAQSWPAEYLIGRSLEYQLEQWSAELRLNESYRKSWMEIFALKAGYFQQKSGLPAYHPRRTLTQLSALLSDSIELAKLVPGQEAQADALVDAEDLKAFWYSLSAKRKEGFRTSTVDQFLRRAIAHFAERLAAREAVRRSESGVAGAPLEDTSSESISALPVAISVQDVAQVFVDANPVLRNGFVPPEWQPIIQRALTSSSFAIRDRAGTGKTHLLYALGAALWQNGDMPLYVSLLDYVAYAPEMDLIQFAAQHGAFGQAYRDESLRKQVEQALAEAERQGHLVILADDGDELFENEIALVYRRLKGAQRLVWTERSPRLGLDERQANVTGMPKLSQESIEGLLQAAGIRVSSVPTLLEQLRAAGFVNNLALLLGAARMSQERTHGMLPAVLDAWVAQRLSPVRQRGAEMNLTVRARELLRQLSTLRLGMTAYSREPAMLTREQLRKAFRGVYTRVQTEEDGWPLVDLLVRAGLLEPHAEHWEFAWPGLTDFLGAEQIMSEPHLFYPHSPQERQMMRWIAALIAYYGRASELEIFAKSLCVFRETFAPTAVLDAVDWLVELDPHASPAVAELYASAAEQLRALAQVNGPRVRSAALRQAKRLGVDSALPEPTRPPDLVCPPDVLDSYASDPSALAQQLNLPQPRGTEIHWLENVLVQGGLLERLCLGEGQTLKLRCAAWLRRSSLSKRLVVSWLPPRRISVLEALAFVAMDDIRDPQTRMAALSVLTRDETILRLWQLGTDYHPLVYELLLALDRRLFRRYDSTVWQLAD